MKRTIVALCFLVGLAGSGHAQQANSQQRLVRLDGTLNTRDIGGYRTTDGREVVWGRLFRSSELSYLSDRDLHALEAMHVSTVVDFRAEKESADAPDRLPAGARRVASSVIGDKLDHEAIQRFLKKNDFPAGMYDEAKVSAYGPFYRMLTLVNSYDDPGYVDKLTGYSPFFHQLLEQPADSAIVFHCTGGRDRTGVGTALLLYLLGVPEQTIEQDYVASNEYLQPDRDDPNSVAFEKFRFSNVYVQPITNRKFQEVAASLGTTPEKIHSAISLRPEYLRSLFGNIRRRYGSIEDFMASRMGIGPQDVMQLRAKFTTASRN